MVRRPSASTATERSKNLKSIADRLVDPLTIFRAHVYDANFNGSFSIKDVAPAILGKKASYDGMAVGDGNEAHVTFLQLISPDTPLEKKKTLQEDLFAYCQKDTLCMVELVWWLFEISNAYRSPKKSEI